MAYCKIAYSVDMGVNVVLGAMLRAQDIDVRDLTTAAHVSIGGAQQGYFIEVNDSDVKEAVAMLVENDFGHLLLTASDML